MHDLFHHWNHPAVLESHVTLLHNEPHADAIIIDGASLVNILPPSSKTFEDYAVLDVLPTGSTGGAVHSYRDITSVMREQTLCFI